MPLTKTLTHTHTHRDSFFFFFLNNSSSTLEVCSQQVSAVMGIFGSMTASNNWVHEVMNVLDTKGANITLHYLIVIIQMSECPEMDIATSAKNK